jgi:amphi-Trp domain-containing protein
MTEEVLFETEQSMDRSEIASYLHTVADRLDAGESVGLEAGDQRVTLDPPARPTFEVKAERESDGGPDELSVEFEIEWNEGEAGAGGDGRLSIE